ncbi:sensor histidine kinase [Pseudomonadota bacterium]
MTTFPNTFTFRLTLWYASAFVLFLGLALLILYVSIFTTLSQRMDDDLVEDVAEYQSLLANGGITRVIEEIKLEEDTGEFQSVFMRLLDKNGNSIFTSDLSHWQIFQTDLTIVAGLATSASTPIFTTKKFPTQEYETRMVYGRIGPETILHIGESMADIQEIMELLLSVSLIMFFLVVPVASGVGWIVARRAASGIKEVSNAATDIERGEFDRRAAVYGHSDEIQDLATTFNSMAERIRALIFEMREMTDNIAHDLRSPLARIRAISEVALSKSHTSAEYKSAASDTLEECDRLIKLINTTLDVAEAEAGVGNILEEEVDLSNLAEDACELFEPVAEENHISLSSSLDRNCRTRGNKQNLQRMLSNLLDNAIKYTPPKGEVTVNLSRNAEEIKIAVTDTGLGIPLHDQHRVFERFFRCDQSRAKDGCGLGLSFARAVARTHGGDITVRSIPKKTSTFVITLPTNLSSI